MAVTQSIAKFECGKIPKESRRLEDEVAYHPIAFKRGGDMRAIVEGIVRHKLVSLDAAPAAGKTTILPIHLARLTRKMVLLVLPFPQLARVTRDHVQMMALGTAVKLWAEVEDVVATDGLVVTHAGCLAAYWLQTQQLSLPECILLHDEAHESGAATALVKALGPVLQGVISYVKMSATSKPTGARKMESGGSVREMMFVPSSYLDPWSVEEPGAPWSVDSTDGNILIFEDDLDRAKRLVRAYEAAGVVSFHWTHKTSADEVADNTFRLFNTKERKFAVVADSTYRSGYSLPVSTIVDSGKVRRRVVDSDGRVVCYVRNIYEFERVQSSCRGGRINGLSSIYWRPSVRIESKMAVLEQTDMEVLAAMLTVLNVDLPEYLSRTVAANGWLPRDLFSVVVGDEPIASLSRHSLCRVKEFNTLVEEALSKKAMSSAGSIPIEVEEEDWVRDLRANLNNLSMFREKVVEEPQMPVFGNYLSADEVDGKLSHSVFPDGTASVLRVLDNKSMDTVLSNWSDTVKSQALTLLLNSYNSVNVQLKGSAKALQEVKAVEVNADVKHLREWAMRVSEGLLQLTVSAENLYDKIVEISRGRFTLRIASFDLEDQENKFRDCLTQSYKSASVVKSVSYSVADIDIPTLPKIESSRPVGRKERRVPLWFYSNYSIRDQLGHDMAGIPMSKYRKKLIQHERSSSASSSSSIISNGASFSNFNFDLLQ